MFSQFLFDKALKYSTLRTCSGISACAYGPDREAHSIEWHRVVLSRFPAIAHADMGYDTLTAAGFGHLPSSCHGMLDVPC